MRCKKMEKICNECGHRWDGDEDDKVCPSCHDEEGAYNIYYKTIDWNTEYDGYHDNYEDAMKEAREMIRDGSTRVPIYEIYDNGDDTSEGEGVDHFGIEYHDDSIDIDSIAAGEAEPPWHLPLQCRFCGHIGLPYPSSGDSKCPSCMHWQYKDRRVVLQKLEQYREHFEPEDKRYKSINECIVDVTATDKVLVEFLYPEELKWVKEAMREELV